MIWQGILAPNLNSHVFQIFRKISCQLMIFTMFTFNWVLSCIWENIFHSFSLNKYLIFISLAYTGRNSQPICQKYPDPIGNNYHLFFKHDILRNCILNNVTFNLILLIDGINQIYKPLGDKYSNLYNESILIRYYKKTVGQIGIIKMVKYMKFENMPFEEWYFDIYTLSVYPI